MQNDKEKSFKEIFQDNLDFFIKTTNHDHTIYLDNDSW